MRGVDTEWTDVMIATLNRMRDDGEDARAIAAGLGISRRAVENQLLKMGMPIGRAFARAKAASRTAFGERLPRADIRRERSRYA
jgi:hypothetical protein